MNNKTINEPPMEIGDKPLRVTDIKSMINFMRNRKVQVQKATIDQAAGHCHRKEA